MNDRERPRPPRLSDDARGRLRAHGTPTDPRVLLQGFSASAMFANRFTVLHPQRVRAATIGSPGGWPIAPVVKQGIDALKGKLN